MKKHQKKKLAKKSKIALKLKICEKNKKKIIFFLRSIKRKYS